MQPAAADRSVRRTLLIIGGAEDRVGRSVVLKRFVKLAGGRRSRSSSSPPPRPSRTRCPRPTATCSPASRRGRRGRHPKTRREARDPDMVALLDDATGVFLTGGSQLKLAQNARRHAGRRGDPPGPRPRRRHRRHLGGRLDHEPTS